MKTIFNLPMHYGWLPIAILYLAFVMQKRQSSHHIASYANGLSDVHGSHL